MEAINEGKAEVPVKKRYEWIDNARLLAALMIIYAHMWAFFPDEPMVTSRLAKNFTFATVLYGRVPYFLVLAGYFLGRKITWHKAVDRAFWLLVPFVIWNFIVYVAFYSHGISWEVVRDIPNMLGIGCVFSKDIHICNLPCATPAINVTWFLRDIIVLSLLSPILVRFKGVAMGALAVALSFSHFNFMPNAGVMLAPHTCFYYLLGTCLCNFRIDDAYYIFNKRFTPVFIVVLTAALVNCFVQGWRGRPSMQVTLMGALFGAMLIAYCGVLIEKYLPKLSKWLAPCGPACFLVFVLHFPILKVIAPMLPDWIAGTWLVWLVPVPTCALIIVVFLLMKRYTPWLMPYLGHMKVPKKQAG